MFKATNLKSISMAQLMGSLRRVSPDTHPLEKAYVLAMAVCAHFLGIGWAERYMFSGGGPNKFIQQPTVANVTVDAVDTMFTRTIDLGEMLFNLQSVAGFAGRLAQLAGGQIEDTCAELETGKLLWMQGTPFRFVEVQGKKGSDFDIEVQVAGGLWVAADTKNKIETTKPSENTVASTLGKARSQLPADRPGFIFLRIPASWLVPDPSQFEPAERAIKAFLRKPSRVASIKLHTFATIPISLTHSIQSLIVQEFDNEQCRFESPAGWQVFNRRLAADMRWQFLLKMAGLNMPVFGNLDMPAVPPV